MNAMLLTTMLAFGQVNPAVPAPASTALDGVWRVVAAEVNGRPEILSDRDRSIAIQNNTLTLPGVAALHGTVRLELGPRGTLLAVPAALGTGNRADPTRTGTVAGTSGTGIIGAASGVYVRTADYLVLTIGDPSAATATGAGVGGSVDDRPTPTNPTPNPASAGRGTVGTVGQPPVSLILRRATGTDAPPSTAASSTPTVVPPPSTNAPTMRRVSSVIGSNVTLSDGSTAGQINDVVYGNGGAIDYAVIGNNGVFAAVPWNGLAFGANGLISLPLNRDQFGTIPTFAANAWSNLLTDPAFMQRLQTTFGNFRDANGRAVFSNQTATAQMSRMAQTGTTANHQSNFPSGATQGTNPGSNQGTNRPTTNPNGANQGTPRPPQPAPATGPQPAPAKPPASAKAPPKGIL